MRLAQAASSLCENEVVKGFFSSVEKALFEKWLSTDPKDVDMREILYFQIQLSRNFKNYFAATIANGKAAAEMLDMLLNENI